MVETIEQDDRSLLVQVAIASVIIISFALCVVGNMWVLYASIGHNAIKLDKLSVTAYQFYN